MTKPTAPYCVALRQKQPARCASVNLQQCFDTSGTMTVSVHCQAGQMPLHLQSDGQGDGSRYSVSDLCYALL